MLRIQSCKWLLSGVASVALLAGCVSAPKMNARVENQGDIKPLLVEEVLVAATPEGVIRANATIVNDSKETILMKYRVKWINVNGMQVWDDEPWKPQIIYGNQRYPLQVVSPTKAASDFRIVIQVEGKQ